MPNGSFIKILGISEPTCDNIFTTNPLARSFENWTRLAKTNFFKLHSSYRQGFLLWLVGCWYNKYLVSETKSIEIGEIFRYRCDMRDKYITCTADEDGQNASFRVCEDEKCDGSYRILTVGMLNTQFNC